VRIALAVDGDVPAEENDYIRALLAAGLRREEIVVLRPGDTIRGAFDGVVIGGGDDVDPVRYGREILEGANVEVDHGRDSVDFPVYHRTAQQILRGDYEIYPVALYDNASVMSSTGP